LVQTSTTLPRHPQFKTIRLVAGDHDIDCKIEGFGAMQLKSGLVKKC
jgi:protein PhnA